MTGIAFEDFTPGTVIEGGPVTVTEAEIVAFAREFDPQPFHLDPEAAKATFVGRLIGSGWQTAGFGMRLLQQHVFRGATSMGSPGIDELRWLRPVLPGDRSEHLGPGRDLPGLEHQAGPRLRRLRHDRPERGRRDGDDPGLHGDVSPPRCGAAAAADRSRRRTRHRPGSPTTPSSSPSSKRLRIGAVRDLGAPPVHARGHRGLRAGLRPAGLPSRSRGRPPDPFRRRSAPPAGTRPPPG